MYSNQFSPRDLWCSENRLERLKVSSVNLSYFFAHDNPNLTCIELPSIELFEARLKSSGNYESEETWKIDSISSFSESCLRD